MKNYQKILITAPILLTILLAAILINPPLSHRLQTILQTINILSVMAFMTASMIVVNDARHSFFDFLLAVLYSYAAFFRQVTCPLRKQVIIRYHTREWKYTAHASLILFQALTASGMIEHLYSGEFNGKSLLLYLGSIGLFGNLTYLTFTSIKKHE